jgi:hypothetical protein
VRSLGLWQLQHQRLMVPVRDANMLLLSDVEASADWQVTICAQTHLLPAQLPGAGQSARWGPCAAVVLTLRHLQTA